MQIGLPDIAAIDHAQGNNRVVGQQADRRFDFVLRIDCIEMQSLYGQLAGEGQVFLELSEVGGEQYLDLSGVQGLVRGFEGVLPV